MLDHDAFHRHNGKTQMIIGILGSGSWGSALSIVLSGKGHTVYLWSNDPLEAEKIAKTRRLAHKLPGVTVPPEVKVTSDWSCFMPGAELLVVAVPSKHIRSLARLLAGGLQGRPKLIVNATKGLEAGTLLTMSEVLEEEIAVHTTKADRGVLALSGPSHAEEVAFLLPTAIVAAHADGALAAEAQEIFQTPRFRVYTNTDRKGVEIGAALKNVLAVAVGISDGLGFGDNARAALISRGLYELSLAGRGLGARPETFTGLSGLGDLVVTCTSRHSRNRKFGELIAQGYSPDDAEEEIGMVVEGRTTVQAVPALQQRIHAELPISNEVYAIVLEGKDPRHAVESLMLRELKSETWPGSSG